MAMQTSVSASKVLILVGAGLTGSVVLRSGHLADIISQLQVLMNGVNEAETSPGKYDTALLAAQIRQLAQEIRELSLSGPVTIFNGNSASSGSYASYILPAAALGAMGYCYMWWKGWSFSDVMFVTKHNMANAVASVSKQLEHVSEALASTKRHLTKRLENLDWKLDEQIETSKSITVDIKEVKSNLNQIEYDIDWIHQMVSGLEGKIELLEDRQDMTNSGLLYLCQAAESMTAGVNTKVPPELGSRQTERSYMTLEETSVKGLQFIAEDSESRLVQDPVVNPNEKYENPRKSISNLKPRIIRPISVGFSLTKDILGSHP